MVLLYFLLCIFFFQAEDGIRDLIVTGVQTCALPILAPRTFSCRRAGVAGGDVGKGWRSSPVFKIDSTEWKLKARMASARREAASRRSSPKRLPKRRMPRQAR